PVAVGPVPRGSVDVARAVEIVAASNPQAVMYLGQAKPAAAVIKGLAAKGVRTQFFVLSVASGLHSDLGEAASGVIVTQVVPYPFAVTGQTVVREYQKTMATLDNST